MKKIIFALIALTFIVSSCGPTVYVTRDQRKQGFETREVNEHRTNNNRRRGVNGSLIFIKENPRHNRITVVVDDKIRFDMSNDTRKKDSKMRQLRLKPGRHDIKIFVDGKLIDQRSYNVVPNRDIRISL
ncbi:MAG: hypothetical protein Q8S04_09255 [Bacteroidales bacterium]|nr:hypothetical protein [Bacteroidales bacterium]